MAPIGSLVPMGLVYATRNRVCYPLGAIASITLEYMIQYRGGDLAVRCTIL